jgi:mannosyltransferase
LSSAWKAAVSVGLFAFVLGVLGSWIPSFWYDEVATVYSARRTMPQLVDLLRTTDVVHGGYYIGIHLWGNLFGFSQFSIRLPGAIAVGAAAAGVVVLGTRVSSMRVGILSGLVFAVLPRVTWAAVEARSYALTAAAAVWLTVLFLVALQTRSRWWWAAYCVVLAVSIVLFVYLATLVAVHLVILLWRRRFRTSIVPWGLAVVVAVLITSPFLRVVLRQAGQVSWIPPLDSNFPRVVLEYQWFLGAPWFGVMYAIILALGVAAAWRARRSERKPKSGLVPIAITWMLLPMAVMAAYSLVRSPIYLDRYFTFTTPAVALLAGAALARLRVVPWLPFMGIAALVAASAPAYIQQRTEWAKPLNMDFSAANAFAEANIEPGDCVLFGRAAWNPSSQRLVEDVDPSSFAGVRDVGKGKDAASTGQLWDEELPLADIAPALGQCDVVWYFTDRERSEVENLRLTSNDRWALAPYSFDASPEHDVLLSAGFQVDRRTTVHSTQVLRLTR